MCLRAGRGGCAVAAGRAPAFLCVAVGVGLAEGCRGGCSWRQLHGHWAWGTGTPARLRAASAPASLGATAPGGSRARSEGGRGVPDPEGAREQSPVRAAAACPWEQRLLGRGTPQGGGQMGSNFAAFIKEHTIITITVSLPSLGSVSEPVAPRVLHLPLPSCANEYFSLSCCYF